MNLILSIIFLTFLATQHTHGDVFDKLTSQGRHLLDQANIPGTLIRQCSCVEQEECFEIMKSQVHSCIAPCWKGFNKVTDRPDDLKKCFDSKNDMLVSLLDCFEDNIHSCDDSHAQSIMIPKKNISEVFRLGVLKVESSKKGSINLIAPIQHIVDAAGEVALCVKNCFIEKNTPSFCFDDKNCQPKLEESDAKKSLRKCTKGINWKSEAGEICECSVKAGLEDLSQYCPMFKLMASRAIRRRN
uniref:CPG4 domain-containing protein n=1 Tax=Rhabditophanes sp. KR3021 TaxID=114890 RepID=A0AC35U767_9BILA